MELAQLPCHLPLNILAWRFIYSTLRLYRPCTDKGILHALWKGRLVWIPQPQLVDVFFFSTLVNRNRPRMMSLSVLLTIVSLVSLHVDGFSEEDIEAFDTWMQEKDYRDRKFPWPPARPHAHTPARTYERTPARPHANARAPA